MHNPESVLENETHTILWNFEGQTDHIISARWPDLVVVHKKMRTSRIVDFADNSIIKIGENTEESTGDLRRLADTQTPVRNYQLTPVWKTRKGVNNNNNNNYYYYYYYYAIRTNYVKLS